MEKTAKITKKMILTAVKNAALAGTVFDGVTTDDVVNYVETTIAQLDMKNEKAKERAAAKRAESDARTDVIASILTDEPQTIADVVAQIEGDEITPAMVSSRAAKLIKAGVADKVSVKVGNRTVVAYKKA